MCQEARRGPYIYLLLFHTVVADSIWVGVRRLLSLSACAQVGYVPLLKTQVLSRAPRPRTLYNCPLPPLAPQAPRREEHLSFLGPGFLALLIAFFKCQCLCKVGFIWTLLCGPGWACSDLAWVHLSLTPSHFYPLWGEVMLVQRAMETEVPHSRAPGMFAPS